MKMIDYANHINSFAYHYMGVDDLQVDRECELMMRPKNSIFTYETSKSFRARSGDKKEKKFCRKGAVIVIPFGSLEHLIYIRLTKTPKRFHSYGMDNMGCDPSNVEKEEKEINPVTEHWAQYGMTPLLYKHDSRVYITPSASDWVDMVFFQKKNAICCFGKLKTKLDFLQDKKIILCESHEWVDVRRKGERIDGLEYAGRMLRYRDMKFKMKGKQK